MRYKKLLMVTVIAASMIMTTTAFAAGADGTAAEAASYGTASFRGMGNFGGRGGFGGRSGFMGNGNFAASQDPIEMLKDRKANLQTLVDNGRITQDQSELEAARIDERIKEIEEFNKLTLEEKKEKVIADFKTKLDQEVKDQNLTQKRADELLESYKQTISGLSEIPCPMSGAMGGRMGGFRGRMGGFGGMRSRNWQ